MARGLGDLRAAATKVFHYEHVSTEMEQSFN